MALSLARLRPTRTTLAAVVGLLWALSFGAVRDFVWSDLRHGTIDVRGLSRSTRALVWLGMTMLLAMIGAVLFNDVWRELSPLVPLTSSSSTVGRGSMLPLAVVPATLFLVAMSWSFLLAGALHGHPALRLTVLGFYLVTALAWGSSILVGYLAGTESGAWPFRLLVAGLVGVPLFFAVRWRAPARAVPEFVVLLLLVSLVFLVSQAGDLHSWHTLGMPLILAKVEGNILFLQLLVTPFIFWIGVEIASVCRQAAGWGTGVIRERLPAGAVYGLLALLAAWQLYGAVDDILERVERTSPHAQLLEYAGGLGVPLIVALAWWVVSRRGSSGALADEEIAEAAERHAFPLILVFYVLGSIGGLSVLGRGGSLLLLSLYLGTVAAMVWLAQTGRGGLGLYLGIFGGMHLWFEASSPGGWLSALTWRGSEPVDFWWVVLFAGTALVWSVRGRLTPERALGLGFLLAMTWLLGQTDLLDDPYTPFFFGYAGIGFIAFGILWDVATAGSWANEDTPRLPRISRVLLYLGYALLTVTVVNWALTTHDLHTVGQFTGDGALVGLERFGRPMLYAVFASTLALLAAGRPREGEGA